MGDRVRITFTVDSEHKEFIGLYAKLKGFDTINNFARKSMYAYMSRYSILKSVHVQNVYATLSRNEKKLLRKIDRGMNKIFTEWSLIKLTELPEED